LASHLVSTEALTFREELSTLPVRTTEAFSALTGMNHPDRTRSFLRTSRNSCERGDLSLLIPARLIVCLPSVLPSPEILISAENKLADVRNKDNTNSEKNLGIKYKLIGTN
jgi:hypothetical protein